MLTKIISLFERGNMQRKYNFLSYRIDSYFHDYKLAIETDENRYNDISIDYETKRLEAIEQELGCRILELILTKKTLIFLILSMKYLHIVNNQLKNIY